MKKLALLIGMLVVMGQLWLGISLAQTDSTLFHPDPRIVAEVQEVDGQTRLYLSFTEVGTCKFVYATTDSEGLEPWPTEEMVEENSWGEQDCATGSWEIKPYEWGVNNFPRDGEQVIAVWLLVRDQNGGWENAEVIDVSALFAVPDTSRQESYGYFGLVLNNTPLLNAIRNDELASLQAGQEVYIAGRDGQFYLVTAIQGEDTTPGFVSTGDIEVALRSSPTFRQYETQCVAQPTDGEAVGIAGYTHELYFNVEEPDVYSLYFNLEPLTLGRSQNAQLVTDEPLTFEIGGRWIAERLVSGPDWDQYHQWQLVWPC